MNGNGPMFGVRTHRRFLSDRGTKICYKFASASSLQEWVDKKLQDHAKFKADCLTETDLVDHTAAALSNAYCSGSL